jgi:lipoprotein-anchoring transpeptidase ErfK/SrfK
MSSRRARSFLRGGLLAAAVFAAVALSGLSAHAELAGPMRMASLDLPGVTENTSEAPGAQVVARIDLSDQKMHIYVGEKLAHVFPVSTGRKGYGTPAGRYQVEWMHPKGRSRKYQMAPMPWSVFFHGGYAVHGTTDLRRLGRPASHGCVRLDPKNAKVFYKLVDASGRENTLISIVR